MEIGIEIIIIAIVIIVFALIVIGLLSMGSGQAGGLFQKLLAGR